MSDKLLTKTLSFFEAGVDDLEDDDTNLSSYDFAYAIAGLLAAIGITSRVEIKREAGKYPLTMITMSAPVHLGAREFDHVVENVDRLINAAVMFDRL